MYLIYAFILFELCLLFLNSCIYSIHVFIIIEFMYLLNSCIYYFLIHVFIIFEYMYLLFLTIKLFLCFYLLLQEPTDIPSRKKLMRWVCARGWCVRRGSLL